MEKKILLMIKMIPLVLINIHLFCSLKQCKLLVNENRLWTPGTKSLKHAFYELCCAVSKGHIKQEQAVSVIADLCVSN
jgi:hypothetical protein